MNRKLHAMPSLVRLYIRQCAVGFALSAVFCCLLFWFDVARLWTLVSNSDVGLMAAAMLFVANGIVFAGAQFGITVMRMGSTEDEPAPPSGGHPVHATVPIPVRTDVPAVPRRT